MPLLIGWTARVKLPSHQGCDHPFVGQLSHHGKLHNLRIHHHRPHICSLSMGFPISLCCHHICLGMRCPPRPPPPSGSPTDHMQISLWRLPKHGKHANAAGASGAIRGRASQRNICQKVFPRGRQSNQCKGASDTNVIRYAHWCQSQIRSVYYTIWTISSNQITLSGLGCCCWRVLFCARERLQAFWRGWKLTGAKQQIEFMWWGGGGLQRSAPWQ